MRLYTTVNLNWTCENFYPTSNLKPYVQLGYVDNGNRMTYINSHALKRVSPLLCRNKVTFQGHEKLYAGNLYVQIGQLCLGIKPSQGQCRRQRNIERSRIPDPPPTLRAKSHFYSRFRLRLFYQIPSCLKKKLLFKNFNKYTSDLSYPIHFIHIIRIPGNNKNE